MGSFKDDDDKSQPSKRNSTVELDLGDTETQILDSRSALDGMERKGDSDDALKFLQSPGLFDDTVPLEDVETQVVNLGGETQVLSFGGETQAVDDLNCAEDICTQLFDDCNTEVVVDTDDEETERTEVLGDTEEWSDVDSVKRVGSHPVHQENMLQTALHKKVGGVSKAARTIEECNTGPLLGGFTSLRVASIRASGLAARTMALKGTNSSSCSIISDSQLLKQHDAGHSGETVIRDSSKFWEDIDQRHTMEEYADRMKGSGNENKFRVNKSAVRKLFSEDTSTGKGLNNNLSNTDQEAELSQLFASENELAGLSYVDSQEPGEASQTIALDFVDKFLKVNVTEFDQEVEIIKSTGGKSKPLSGAKGTQSLAKSVNRICSAAGGIFDWDDNREDEGGGEFFRKKKEAFFDNGRKGQKSCIQPRDPKSVNPNNCRAVKGTRNEEEKQDICDKAIGLVYSDSKLLLHKPKKNDESGRKLGKNLIKELDEKSDIGSRDGIVKTGTETDNPDMLNVGFDTQMAAEAMEALCFGVGTNHDSSGAKHVAETHHNDSAKGKYRKRSESKKHILQKRPCTSKSGVITRQSNQTKKAALRLSRETSISSRKCSVKVRNQCDAEFLQAEPKRATSVAKEHFVINGSEDLRNSCSELIEQGRNEKALKKSEVDEIDKCHGTASSGQLAVKKRGVQEQLGTYTPIACRTRPKGENQPQRDAKASTDIREDMNHLTGLVAPKRKRSRTGLNASANEKCTNTNFNKPGDLKKAELSYVKQSDSKLSGISTIKIDALDHVGRRKICQKLSSQEEANGKSFARCKISDAKSTCIDSGIKVKKRSPVVASPVLPACMTPVHCVTPVNEASPICMGDEYHKQSCRKNLSRSLLTKEISRLTYNGPEHTSTRKDSRKRREIAQVQVLFSHHLDGDIIKQQKKILTRLGASVASSISDATHFVADEFVRTRNMLEAIAFGKPVVTHLWLESCGQASCLIDERNYILRDTKKEKEFGFSLPVSLARACQHPLLKGQKVLITHNTKPGKEILASLVKAVHGMAVERIGRSALKDDNIPGDLLVLSCEEDYADCVPFLEKGSAVYSSELLLNGIVTQKLEYERHRLFGDHVRRTRSTIWLRKDDDLYIPVTKCK